MAVSKGKARAKENGKRESTAGEVALLNTLGGAFARRLGWLERAGFQYGGKRDIYTEAGYEPQGTETFPLFNGLYERNEIAGRVVDLPAKTTWKIPPEVVEADGDDTSDFCQAFTTLAERLRLWQHFEMVDRRAGIGTFAVLYLGLRGAADDQTPVQKLSGPEDILFLQPYDEGQTKITSFVTNNQDERFGRPEFYQVTFAPGTTAFPKQQGRVHWSHLMHVAEDSVDGVYGRPRLKRVLNRMFDLDKITASTAEAYWQTVARILQGKIGENVTASETLLDDLDDKLAEVAHNLRRQFVGKGVELQWLGSTPPGVKDIADLYFALIAIGCGIPRRILFGNEQGDLASSTDQATFFGLIAERQKQYAEPLILRPFIDKLVTLGALPKPGQDGYEVVWPELFELTELETADANLKRAQTAAALTPMGGDPTTLVEIDEERNVWLVAREPTEAPPPGAAGAGTPGVEGGDTGDTGDQGGGKGSKYTWGDGDIEVEGGGAGGGAATAAQEAVEDFDEDQPRDDRGRWTDAGGGGAAEGGEVRPGVGRSVTARAQPGERSQGVVNMARSAELGTLVGAKNKECYKNAAVGLMSAGPGARYVEGYAVSAATPFVAFEHAWIETADGNILELTPTWREGEGAAYFPARRWTRGQVEHHVHQGGAEGADFPIAGPGSARVVGRRELAPYAAASKAAWKHIGVDLGEALRRQGDEPD